MLLPFELDPQIIHHIIYSQAGSIGKAIIELIMNSVDAGAKSVHLNMTREGFSCSDDGAGFVSREDVLRYFGRFGTPHEEGDATYGRFRLGRGQIMAHASTVWKSNYWTMTVDTQKMGYHYDLDEVSNKVVGCAITGVWYETLTDAEYLSAVQEIRDLVRYTPVSVELNGKIITRNPINEKWDYEDDFAYYRVKEDGAVSIYNQGVLVRHDATHIWGAGGLIVSKKAVGLNVSRTEILRKTCPVWKNIAKQFKIMAEAICAKLGDHRKTEARREKYALALLSGDSNILEILEKEEVITVLPGKKHLTVVDFLHKAHYQYKDKFTVVENGFDIPKGESLAMQKVALIVHPQTLDRFHCYNPMEFHESLERVFEYAVNNPEFPSIRNYYFRSDHFKIPALISFAPLRDAFIYQTKIVTEKESLDKETRRAWTALKWCLQQYAGACLGENRYRNGRLAYNAKHMHIFLGESNSTEAWTDGDSYIAFNVNVVKKLKTDTLKTVAYLFSLLEHEIAHEGDSVDCGHDEAFYQRYHDISISMAQERQRFIHIWLMKYTTSLENEGKKANGNAWRERYLVNRAGNGRIKKGLGQIIEPVQQAEMDGAATEENLSFINLINRNLHIAGINPIPPNWSDVIEIARKEAERMIADYKNWNCRDMVDYFNPGHEEPEFDFDDYDGFEPPDLKEEFDNDHKEIENAPVKETFPPEFEGLVYPHETMWLLERNAAAAGFYWVIDYLKWRENDFK